ncbi:hypothetical protein UFOVP116_320 [uncultured Caudovirales phage]|uniref:Uncharacterized protein n=1 Tax=uncultured Caudovirales phage TaxID=2100421 RepID=A0A6J5L724_9CAUD|nr:hypothetical protein UFOVP116_320 [uncultured Caudovirales phage]
MHKSCIITNTSNGKDASAGIIDFIPNKFLVVAVQGVKITLQYNMRSNKYIGKSAGLEFTSAGPQGSNYKGYSV